MREIKMFSNEILSNEDLKKSEKKVIARDRQ